MKNILPFILLLLIAGNTQQVNPNIIKKDATPSNKIDASITFNTNDCAASAVKLVVNFPVAAPKLPAGVNE